MKFSLLSLLQKDLERETATHPLQKSSELLTKYNLPTHAAALNIKIRNSVSGKGNEVAPFSSDRNQTLPGRHKVMIYPMRV